MTTWLEKLQDDPKYIAKAGRVPYKVDFSATDYDGLAHCKPAPLAEANCWSSYSRLLSHMHLPVFDVDIDKDRPAAASPLAGMYPIVTDGMSTLYREVTVEEAVRRLMVRACGGDETIEINWVPSTTKGHHHVYVEYALTIDAYLATLMVMEHLSIIEHGYCTAALSRRATFVRLPGVLRDPREKSLVNRSRDGY